MTDIDLKRQKTKIIATLGDLTPSNDSQLGTYKNGLSDENEHPLKEITLDDLVDMLCKCGADMFRLNLAHIPDTTALRQKFPPIKEAILKASKKYGRYVGLLADLPGPKIRFKDSNWLVPEETLRVVFDDRTPETVALLPKKSSGAESTIPTNPRDAVAQITLDGDPFYSEKPQATGEMLRELDDRIAQCDRSGHLGKPLAFIGDNDCTLRVQSVDLEKRMVLCDVIAVKNTNRIIGSKKGFTVRGIKKPIDAFTKSDKEKLRLLLELDFEGASANERVVSHIGISFCQKRDDVKDVLHFVYLRVKEIILEKKSLTKNTGLTSG